MQTVLLALWPLFALIGLGYYLQQRKIYSSEFWAGAERLNYFILFPALLVGSLAKAPLDNPQLPRLALAVILVVTIAWIILQIAKRLLKWPASRFGVKAQGIIRFNTYLGLAAVNTFYGTEGMAIAALIMAVLVPAGNITAVWALSAQNGIHWRQLLMPILKNPLIQSCIVGVLINLTGIGLPFGTDEFLKLMAAASLPLGLLCIGAALQTQTIKDEAKPIIINSLLRLCLMPLCAYIIARLLGLEQLELVLLVIFFALPTAPTAYVLARQLGGDSQLMAGIITLQTIFAAITLPIIINLLN
ncbi:AEC family transporter [Pseudomonas sp. F1_0610]|uniref:AEC family transporter n=1 Tax=Pseudomonas sp. F1_0610 TaxID=3114284 RepID=UPI0039C09C3E